MPSLPTTKSEPVAATDSTDYLKNMVVMMEKKIRNLEKRKGKLEDYKERQARGQELNEEQLKAVTNLSAVLCQIDLLQDLIKQFNTQSAEVQKQQKRRLKKEKFEQAEREKKRFTDVLMLQSVLNNLGDETIREQFSSGSEGSVKLETAELDNLDEVYKLLNPERSTTESVVEQMKSAADHLQALVDGREKAVSGTTYRELHDLISKIQDCPFFTEAKPADQEPEVDDGATEKEYVVVQSDEVPAPDSQEVQAVLPPDVPAEPEIPVTTHEETYQPASEMHQSLPQQAPTKSFEQIVGNVQGRFNFIQDSEIDMDSPSHVDPAVLSVHQMPTHYQNPPPQMSQPPPENSMYAPPSHSDSQYHQYNMHTQPSNSTAATFPHNNTPPAATENDMGMMNTVATTNKPTSDTYTNSMFSQQNAEPQHGSASTEVPEHMSSHQSDDYHRGGNMRQGGFRDRSRGGGGPGGNYSNGYNSRGGGGGGFRSGGDRGGYKGDKPSGNGFGDQRRGRGGGSRGGGYRGGPPSRGGRGGSGTGGRYRGQSQQSHTQQ